MNKFKNLNNAKNIMGDSKKLREFHTNFKRWTEAPKVDKFKKGFNADDRFKSFNIEIFFSAYTGVYGSSSVSSCINLSSDKEVGLALVKFLSDNEEMVIKGIADNLKIKAESIVESAREELAMASEQLDSFNID